MRLEILYFKRHGSVSRQVRSAKQTGHLLRETMFREILRLLDLNNG